MRYATKVGPLPTPTGLFSTGQRAAFVHGPRSMALESPNSTRPVFLPQGEEAPHTGYITLSLCSALNSRV